jgi:aspartate aminotransferase-like enzyme
MEKHRLKDSSPATPAMSLIFALDYQLDRIISEGLDNRLARHSAMAGRIQEWAETHDQSIFAPAGFRSQTVTTIRNERGIDIPDLNAFLRARGMRIAAGYGPLKGITYRIAHMGETRLEDVERLLEAMVEYLQSRGS